jgi:His-Xaa-Ser system protein HxsD
MYAPCNTDSAHSLFPIVAFVAHLTYFECDVSMELPKETGVETNSIALRLETRQFSRDAVLRAAYWFSKDLYFEFPPSEGESTFSVVIKAKNTIPTLDDPKPKTLGQLVSEFQNALVDSELRVRVQKETSSIRELIIAKAFAEAGVLEDGPPGSFDDPVLAAEKSTKSNLVTITPKE